MAKKHKFSGGYVEYNPPGMNRIINTPTVRALLKSAARPAEQKMRAVTGNPGFGRPKTWKSKYGQLPIYKVSSGVAAGRLPPKGTQTFPGLMKKWKEYGPGQSIRPITPRSWTESGGWKSV